VSVDAGGRRLVVRKRGIGIDGPIAVALKSHARVCRDEALAPLRGVRPGERVAIDFYLDDYTGGGKAEEKKLKAKKWGELRWEHVLDGESMTMKLLGHYGSMRRRWYIDSATRLRTIPARGIRVLNADQAKRPYGEPPVMWMSARVRSVDARRRRLSVKRAPLTAKEAKGYSFYREITRSGRELDLSSRAKLRMAEVEKWLKDPKGIVTVLADDAVDYCLNGKFGGGFGDIAPGDFVGVRYYPDRQTGGVIAPHTIRISKPIGK
jgi:hypothetical protein